MIRPLAIAILLLPTAALAADPLTGAQILAQIVGNTVEGTAGDVEYTEFYAADGTIHGLGDDGPYTGQWSIEGDRMCFDLGETKECDKVQLDGTMLTLAPPFIVPMFSVTLATMSPAPLPIMRSITGRPRSMARCTLSDMMCSISASFSSSPASCIATLVALLVACT